MIDTGCAFSSSPMLCILSLWSDANMKKVGLCRCRAESFSRVQKSLGHLDHFVSYCAISRWLKALGSSMEICASDARRILVHIQQWACLRDGSHATTQVSVRCLAEALRMIPMKITSSLSEAHLRSTPDDTHADAPLQQQSSPALVRCAHHFLYPVLCVPLVRFV